MPLVWVFLHMAVSGELPVQIEIKTQVISVHNIVLPKQKASGLTVMFIMWCVMYLTAMSARQQFAWLKGR